MSGNSFWPLDWKKRVKVWVQVNNFNKVKEFEQCYILSTIVWNNLPNLLINFHKIPREIKKTESEPHLLSREQPGLKFYKISQSEQINRQIVLFLHNFISKLCHDNGHRLSQFMSGNSFWPLFHWKKSVKVLVNLVKIRVSVQGVKSFGGHFACT